ncbi:MAG: ECF transporter S component [Oscillospiraceae bacterium]|jgi:uncharacterized membrane protein|nr:ECF transporter S component [Oscillospiraceae bacterium]
MKSKTRIPVGKMVQMAVLAAIIVIMAFTPLGLLPINPFLSLTLLPIPVAIGAIVCGPSAGAVLGGLFGVLMFIRGALMGADLGPLLFPISPVAFTVVCVVPRILEGWLGGLIFKALSKIDRTRVASYAVSGFATAAFNTVFFMGGLMLLFWNTFVVGYAGEAGVSGGVAAVALFVMGGVAVQAVIEAVLCAVVSGAVSKALVRFLPGQRRES